MWVEFHDTKGRVQVEDMTPDGLHDAKYQCEQMIEELEDARRSLDADEDED